MPDIYISDKTKKEDNIKKDIEPKISKEDDIEKSSEETQEEILLEKGEGNGLLSSFLYYPENAHFRTQDPEEKIVLLLRRHFITNIPWILISLFMFLVPSILSELNVINVVPQRFQTVILLIWYLFSMAYFYEKFLSWYFQVAIVTDERVVDVDFVSLTYREMTAAKIDMIQDITVQMGGLFQSTFNYGSVNIQTASERPMIEFHNVPKPDAVARILRRLVVEEEQEKIEGRVR